MKIIAEEAKNLTWMQNYKKKHFLTYQQGISERDILLMRR